MSLPKDHIFYGLQLTEEQLDMVNSIMDKDVTCVDAEPGTGKTLLAIATSKLLVFDKETPYKKIIYVFEPIDEGEMGFRPGDQDEKEDAYLGPVRDALLKINELPMKVITQDPYDYSAKCWVLATSSAFKRGVNFEDSIIIVDEAQNFSSHKLKKILTRVNIKSCKVIVIGNTGQCDLKNRKLSGLKPLLELLSQDPRVGIVTLTHCFRGWFAKLVEQLPSD